jgi:WD40 repeat protein
VRKGEGEYYQNRTANGWDAAFGRELLTLAGRTARVWSATLTPYGRFLAMASVDKAGRVSAMNIEDLMTLARRRVTRSLSLEECQKYLRMEQCPPTS